MSNKSIGYVSLHQWITKNKPKTRICEICGLPENHKKLGLLQLSNKTGKLIKDINNFQWVHPFCHRRYDTENKIKHEYNGIIKYLYINDELHRMFKASSAEEGITIQVLTEKVIEEYLKSKETNKKPK